MHQKNQSRIASNAAKRPVTNNQNPYTRPKSLICYCYHKTDHTFNNCSNRDRKRNGVNLVENERVVGEEEENEYMKEEDPYDGAEFTEEEGK